MSDSLFRWFLSLFVVFALAGIGAAFAPGGYSQELADAFAQEPVSWLADNIWLSLAMTVLLLGFMIAGVVGLFLFRRWGRTLSLYSTIAGFVIYPVMGPQLSSALESALLDVSSLLWGAILALAYYSPVASRLSSTRPSS